VGHTRILVLIKYFFVFDLCKYNTLFLNYNAAKKIILKFTSFIFRIFDLSSFEKTFKVVFDLINGKQLTKQRMTE
jgi:hypothetical protein